MVYNLGFLPQGDITITTKVDSTLKSIENSFDLLSRNGAISITCYPGHLEGEREEKAILEMVSKLDKKDFVVCYHKWINREKSPTLIWITKRK